MITETRTKLTASCAVTLRPTVSVKKHCRITASSAFAGKMSLKDCPPPSQRQEKQLQQRQRRKSQKHPKIKLRVKVDCLQVKILQQVFHNNNNNNNKKQQNQECHHVVMRELQKEKHHQEKDARQHQVHNVYTVCTH